MLEIRNGGTGGGGRGACVPPDFGRSFNYLTVVYKKVHKIGLYGVKWP